MKTAVRFLVLLIVVGFVSAALAQEAPNPTPKPKDTSVKGVVTKNADGKITVSVRKGAAGTEVVVTTNDKTVVKVDKKKDATVSDVAVGMTINAKIGADGVAVSINAKTAKPDGTPVEDTPKEGAPKEGAPK